MNNLEVKQLLEECEQELGRIKFLVEGMGEGAHPTPYMRKYAVIRAAGGVEAAFKRIIADRVDRDAHTQLRTFISKKIRGSSSNPRLEVIQSMLADFDEQWCARFNEKIALAGQPMLKGALTDLVKARNSFAHGGVNDLSIDKTIECFGHAKSVLKLLDETLHEDVEAES